MAEKKIKTREVVEKVKDAATQMPNTQSRRTSLTKTAVSKAKSKTEEEAEKQNASNDDNPSPEQYATDKVTETGKNAAENLVSGTATVTKKVARKVKNSRRAKKEASADGDNTPSENAPEQPQIEATKKEPQRLEQKSSANKGKPTSEAPKTETKKSVTDKKQQTKPKAKNVNEDKPNERSNPRTRNQSAPKQKAKREIRNVRSGDKTIISADAGIKQSTRSLENTPRQIKTAQKGTEVAKKSAEVTAKAAKKAEHSARVTAKATAKTAKKSAEATVRAIKVTVAAVKELGALIAAGGTTAVVIIIVLCLLAAIGGTCFGIFLSNDKTTGSDMTMTQAISTLTSEHYANLTAFKEGFTYDTAEVQGDSNIDWKDVLAVYAVKTTTSEDNAFEVVTINEEKLDLLRGLMNDMNKLTGVVTPKVVAQTVVTTDEEGNSVKTTEYVTKKVLTVNIIRLSAEQIIELYNFNVEQKKQLNELMSDGYTDLWNELIGGSGEIIMSGSSWVSKGYFTWPLPETFTITSYFGTRVDPISGEIKTHGGTDIAAPSGTPILAATDGTVVVASYDADGYGFYVKLKHDDTYSTIYGHCSALLVSAGQIVKQGQVIAKVGSTGYSTGSHLHFEVIQNGARVDAINFYE